VSVTIIDSWDIVETWADAVFSSDDVNDWCASNAGGQPYIYEGISERDLPEKVDSPIVGFRPGQVQNGTDAPSYRYELDAFFIMDVARGGREVSGGRRVKYEALKDLSRGFASRVLNALNATAYAPEDVLAEFDYAHFPLVQMGMRITVNVQATMGGRRTWKED
jgi:hypothetical protein